VPHELLRRAPVQALALAQRALAQTPAAARDPREQSLARPFAALALERRAPRWGEQPGEHDQVVLIAEQFGEAVGAAGERAPAEDLGGVAQVLDAFSPFVRGARPAPPARDAALALAPVTVDPS